eukprot:5855234-Lingulodinium_polyedra.AAC.1
MCENAPREGARRPQNYGVYRPRAQHDAVADNPLLAQTSENKVALWPLEGPRWVPPPREVPEAVAVA